MRLDYSRVWDLITTPVRFANVVAAPATAQIPLHSLAVYSKAVAGVSTLFYKDDAGVEHNLSGTAPTHTLLDASTHSDTVAQTVSRGSLIYGNSTPKWDELVIGAANRLLVSNGTDAAWSQADHGLALTGLGDDDHSAYLLASDATNRATFAANWLDLTDGGSTTLHTHAATGSSSGGHIHGITRLVADGVATVFNLSDFAESVDLVSDDGIDVDDNSYTVSADGGQVTFGYTPVAGNVLHLQYVIAGL